MWSGREKAIGLLGPPIVVLAGLIVVLVGVALLSGEAAGSDDAFVVDLGPVEFAVLSLSTLSGFIAAGYLASRLNRGGVNRRMRSSSSSGSPRPSRLLVST